ncbi:MAG TPA: Vitamin B12 dependent methionine synthase activation subunit [Candidatus Mediterraneibacter guildfordensis]|nr:Vitamin B12 dependent methionine synthase activation subunit [Candidatus Mediterraneibacter guildfordensis]
MKRRTNEAVRYLGYGKKTADERTRRMVDEAFLELEQAADPKSICRIFDIGRNSEDGIQIGNLTIISHSLARNLRGCDKAVLFCATLGAETDRLIRRASITDMSRAVILQACAAAYLEEYCDEQQHLIGEEMAREGRFLRPRFSPGYGDFDIHYQEPVMRILDCAKQIGLSMTDGYMMTPSKSVTAVIGAGPDRPGCVPEGCESCRKTDCPYRR